MRGTVKSSNIIFSSNSTFQVSFLIKEITFLWLYIKTALQIEFFTNYSVGNSFG